MYQKKKNKIKKNAEHFKVARVVNIKLLFLWTDFIMIW